MEMRAPTDLVPVGLALVLAEVLVERLERLHLLLLEQPEEAPELGLPPRQAPGPAALVGLPQLPHRLAQSRPGLGARDSHCAHAPSLPPPPAQCSLLLGRWWRTRSDDGARGRTAPRVTYLLQLAPTCDLTGRFNVANAVAVVAFLLTSINVASMHMYRGGLLGL